MSLFAETVALMHAQTERAKFAKDCTSADLKTRFTAIRNFYRLAGNSIQLAGKTGWGIDPYEVNWPVIFTPIESWFWSDIRESGSVFYPQFPVGRFIVDFANPVARVAIECDGAAFHQDKAKDQARDEVLENMGWHVYRITGALCRIDHNDETGELSEAGQFIRRIRDSHGIQFGAAR